jgi:N-acetylglucosaminylphosphatidylinositol deacetylase
VLLVLAHPDDESMFFTPAITHIMSAGASVHLLCLSTGDYDGLGAQRAREVAAAARVLGISTCSVIDDADLQDGPLNAWPAQAIGRRISDALQRTAASHIFTFDSGGVSAHPNHVATHRACVQFVQSHPRIQLLTLHTSHLLLKYLGALAVLLPTTPSTRALHVARVCNSAPQLVVHAMRAHGSQLTWFRWLFIVFSHYTYFNDVVLHQQ